MLIFFNPEITPERVIIVSNAIMKYNPIGIKKYLPRVNDTN
jgi:hypothetical protein